MDLQEDQSISKKLDPDLSVRRVRLDDIHLDLANTNSHNAKNLEAIASSLTRFGQVEPLVVQKSTGRVIGGNGRLEAMKALGMTECDIVEVDFDSTQSTALSIALNRTAELSEWDDDALMRTLESLRDDGVPVEAAGFSDAELDAMLAGVGGDADKDDSDSSVDDAEPPSEFPEHDESIETEYRCPKCSYEWSGKPK